MTQRLPIFLISFNRAGFLERCIAGIRRQSMPTDIIVHDNGSTDAATVSLLESLEKDGIHVVARGPITSAADLNHVDKTVQAYFAETGQPSPYAVSDCDVDLASADQASLDVYLALLDMFPAAECVGPMLTISDIPSSYDLYNRVMNRHIEQFWQKEPEFCETPLGRVAYLLAPIDTTFAIHRAGEPFRRMKSGIRVYHPFEARHLDWYPVQSLADDRYRATSSPNISHWNNATQSDLYRDEALRFDSFRVVDGDRHHLAVRSINLARPA